MNDYSFEFAGAQLHALGSGALWWPDQSVLCVSDLHLGKSERLARRGGQYLPPYETRDTLNRLSADLEKTNARQVICLGDSFDDLTAAHHIDKDDRLWITRLQAGREWVWIEGNHDPGPVSLGGTHLSQIKLAKITFRHIAAQNERFEVSGHYHPKASVSMRGRTVSRPAFLFDTHRLIMPAYGTYTGGLRSNEAPLAALLRGNSMAILTGQVPHCVPLP